MFHLEEDLRTVNINYNNINDLPSVEKIWKCAFNNTKLFIIGYFNYNTMTVANRLLEVKSDEFTAILQDFQNSINQQVIELMEKRYY